MKHETSEVRVEVPGMITKLDEFHPGILIRSTNIRVTEDSEKYLCLTAPESVEGDFIVLVVEVITGELTHLFLSQFTVVPMSDGRWNNINYLFHCPLGDGVSYTYELIDDVGRPVDPEKRSLMFPPRIKRITFRVKLGD